MLSQRMAGTVAIVGAGRVGQTLGLRLHELGWRVGAVVARSAANARRAVEAIGDGRAHAALTRQILGSDVVIISTPDSAIAGVARKLARIGGEEWRGRVVLHTSGALDYSVLRPLERLGAATGSLHPLQTFSRRAAPHLEGAVMAVEGSRAAVRVARRVARELGGVPVVLDGRHKPAYHAAGALAAGHVLAILEAATRILMATGFTRRQATRALLPLTHQTLSNLERLGPSASWTGPLARGDYATVARHVGALRKFPRQYGAAYQALSRLAVSLLARKPRGTLRRLAQIW